MSSSIVSISQRHHLGFDAISPFLLSMLLLLLLFEVRVDERNDPM
jgi:hypothetical protein